MIWLICQAVTRSLRDAGYQTVPVFLYFIIIRNKTIIIFGKKKRFLSSYECKRINLLAILNYMLKQPQNQSCSTSKHTPQLCGDNLIFICGWLLQPAPRDLRHFQRPSVTHEIYSFKCSNVCACVSSETVIVLPRQTVVQEEEEEEEEEEVQAAVC